MPALHRLRTSKEIRDVMQKGFLTRSPFFIARALPGGETPTVAIVASKKRVGRATQRNLVRRRIREAARVAGLDAGSYVFVAHAVAAEAPFEQLIRAMQKVRAR